MAEQLCSYYAVIDKHEEDGKPIYMVNFPDIPNCFTEGKTFQEAVEMAEDVLGTMVGFMLDNGEEIKLQSTAIPEATHAQSVVYIEADLTHYRLAC